MADVFLAQVSIPYYTGIPTDVVTNTFHFKYLGGGTPIAADYDAIATQLGLFYTGCYNTAADMTMAQHMRPALTQLKIYALDDPKPRAPRRTQTLPLTVNQAAASYIPTESAICLSYQGSRTSGISQASRRGRIYLGGLGTAFTIGSTSAFPVPSTGAITRITAAAHNLANNLFTGSVWNWVVYSDKMGTSTTIIGGWVDNAADTQRRRGQIATVRTTWAA